MNDPITPATIVEFLAWIGGGLALGTAIGKSNGVALVVAFLSAMLAIWAGEL